ncbi:unnamed protein product [Arabis nemorensis]|uniref:Uncharacterized protein n=1 Tax=Arabis nemorensis TaxID=586526 RepID=A0A565CL91_9BRAS|nr:unnamed protein product [Arabis nemorensis]
MFDLLNAQLGPDPDVPNLSNNLQLLSQALWNLPDLVETMSSSLRYSFASFSSIGSENKIMQANIVRMKFTPGGIPLKERGGYSIGIPY